MEVKKAGLGKSRSHRPPVAIGPPSVDIAQATSRFTLTCPIPLIGRLAPEPRVGVHRGSSMDGDDLFRRFCFQCNRAVTTHTWGSMQSTDDKTHRNPTLGSATRRQGLTLAVCGLAGAFGVPAPARAREAPLRLACDHDVAASGLPAAWAWAFARDTGLPVAVQPGTAEAVLARTVAGEADAVLSASPALEAEGLAQGLLHDRRVLARLRWVLAGPLPVDAPQAAVPGLRLSARSWPAAVSTDAVGVLQAAAARGGGAALAWMAGTPGAAGERLLDALLQAAGLAPDAVRREPAAAAVGRLAEARARGLHLLAGAWEAPAPTGAGTPAADAPAWGLLADHDPRLRTPVHLLRPLRAAHPASRLYADWLSGPRGRQVLAGRRGVLPPEDR